jgi:hypothetical protein
VTWPGGGASAATSAGPTSTTAAAPTAESAGGSAAPGSAGDGGPLSWADQLFNDEVAKIRKSVGVVPRDVVLRMCEVAALIGIGYEVRALRKALEPALPPRPGDGHG